ncbi:alpha/beta fold hydrolase [Allorhizobium undicola]|uniref:alpha/beta fold hydrolase n=1 Tax=Allorhizobium undicola TaxID=78527 RepID=UPI003D34FF16
MPDTKILEQWIETDDGLRLYLRSHGRPTELPPVICLAGLTRNHRDFEAFAIRLASMEPKRQIICLDSRGRGNSDRDGNIANYNVWREMLDVVHMLDQMQIARADFIGSSRGGLILHFLAQHRPDVIGKLIFNDIGPRIETAGLQQIKAYLEAKPALHSFDDCAKWLKTVHGAAFPALEDNDWREMAHAIYRHDAGIFTPDYDVAIAKQITAIDFDQPVPDLWPQFQAVTQFPLLVIRGENSSLLSDETVSLLREQHPQCTSLIAENQGHTPLLHIDGVFEATVAFLTA